MVLPKIAVCGSASGKLDKNLLARAFKVGQEIARKKAVLLCGATTGYSYEAARGAKSKGGQTVGISPAENKEEHTSLYKKPIDAYDVIIFTGFGMKGRNVVLVRSADAVIIIGGGTGTLNELTIAYDEKKVIGFLKSGSGIELLIDKINQISTKKRPTIILEENAVKLVNKVAAALTRQRSSGVEQLFRKQSVVSSSLTVGS